MLPQYVLDACVVLIILGISAVLTQVFARTMYNRCESCNTLNARRRSQCRRCGEILRG
jgi:hypothetical protein